MADIKREIINVLELLADQFEKEKRADFGELTARILESEAGAVWMKTPENFSVGIAFPVEQALEAAIEERYPGVDARTVHTITEIYVHYSRIKRHVECLIKSYEGWSAIADKSRRLISAYVTWLLTGEMDDFKDRKDPNKRGWDCPSVGTPLQWHGLIKSILSFYMDGETGGPFLPYQELVLQYMFTEENKNAEV